jgi:hypothetical protein
VEPVKDLIEGPCVAHKPCDLINLMAARSAVSAIEVSLLLGYGVSLPAVRPLVVVV